MHQLHRQHHKRPGDAVKLHRQRDDVLGKFEAFLNKTSYPNSHELIKGKLYLQWRRSADNASIEARMAYDGVAGYLAVGPENKGGGHNGMNGAPIVMGVFDPDPNLYGGAHWLNYVGTGVKEYVIHHSLSAFRHWKAPHTLRGSPTRRWRRRAATRT